MNAEQLLTHFDRLADAPDAIPLLRRFILDLAVRGKLVEQDSEDEPASELLKRIVPEKQRLVAEGKFKSLETTEFNNEVENVPFSIPANWVWCRLDDIAAIARGGSPRPIKAYLTDDKDGINWIKISDSERGNTYINKTKEKIRPDGLKKSRMVFPNDLILSNSMSFGYPYILNIQGCIHDGWLVIRTPDSLLDKLFLYHLLLSSHSRNVFSNAAAGAVVQNLNADKVRQLPVPLPPLAEQHRVVAKVNELMALCDRLETARKEREATRDRLAAASLVRLNAPDSDPAVFQNHAAFALNNLSSLTTRPDQIKALRQTILNLAVRGKLLKQDPEDEPASELLRRRKIVVLGAGPFELPESWAWVNVGAVAHARLGKMLDKAKNKGTPRKYLRNINVRWFDFDLSDLLEMRFEDSELPEFELRFGDVLICEGGEPGRAAVWDARETDIYFQKAIHRVRFLDFVDDEFFVKALRASADDGRLAEYFTGTGIKHFTGKGLTAYLFPLPPLAEQRRIVAKVDELMAVCDRLEAGLARGDETRGRLVEAVLWEALEHTSSTKGFGH